MNLAAPASEREAEERSEAWRNLDPFPTITSALLNSADIIDYVTVTGMIFPFRLAKEGEKKLKPASYEVDLLGTVKYWDEVGNEITKTIGVGDAKGCGITSSDRTWPEGPDGAELWSDTLNAEVSVGMSVAEGLPTTRQLGVFGTY